MRGKGLVLRSWDRRGGVGCNKQSHAIIFFFVRPAVLKVAKGCSFFLNLSPPHSCPHIHPDLGARWKRCCMVSVGCLFFHRLHACTSEWLWVQTQVLFRELLKNPYFARFRVSVSIGDFLSLFSSWMCSFVEKKRRGAPVTTCVFILLWMMRCR